MIKLKTLLFVFIFSFITLGVMSSVVNAAEIQQVNVSCADSNSCSSNTDFYATLKLVINTIISFIGIAAVIVIIISGFTFATSGGDAKAIETAKNRIVYSVIGIIVVLIAAGIVNFVLGSVK
jgi:hypothetical protein